MLLKDDVAALALYDRAQTYISKLPSSPSSITQDIPITKDDISSLAKSMQSEMTHAHAQVILSNPSGTESATKVFPMNLSRLTVDICFDELTSLSSAEVSRFDEFSRVSCQVTACTC